MSTFITSQRMCGALSALMLLFAEPVLAQWPQGFGGDNSDNVVVIRKSSGGDLFVAGHFGGSIATAGGTVSANDAQDVFVARFGPGGQLKWLRAAGGAGINTVNDLILDGGQNAYLVGEFENDMQFGGSSLSSSGRLDGYVAKISANGDWSWSRKIGSGGNDSATGLVLQPGDLSQVPTIPDSLILVGSYQCQVTFVGPDADPGDGPDDTTLNRQNLSCDAKNRDLFVARISTAGTWRWAVDRGSAATGVEQADRIVRSDDGRIFIGGSLTVGGQQTLRDDSFDADWSGWTPLNGNVQRFAASGSKVGRTTLTYSGFGSLGDHIFAYPYDLSPWGISSPSLAFHSQETWADSPQIDASSKTSLLVSFAALRGFDGTFFRNFLSSYGYCTSPWSCYPQEEGQVSEQADWDDDLWLQFYGSDGQWHNVFGLDGGGSAGELIVRDGSSAIEITDARAMHSGLRFRVYYPGGAGDFGYPPPSDPGHYDWWYFDSFKLSGLGSLRPFVLALNNAGTDSPSFAAATTLPDGVQVEAMAFSDATNQLLLTGERNFSAGNNWCSMENGQGAYIASLGVSGSSIDGSCQWGKGFTAGRGLGVDVDSDGYAYFTGRFSGLVTFFNGSGSGIDGTLESTKDPSDSYTDDIFIGAINLDGTWDGGWITGGGVADAIDNIPALAGGQGRDEGIAINASNGVVYVGGAFEGTARFGTSDSVVAVDAQDAFLVNLGSDGRFFQEEHWTVGVPLTPPAGAKVDDFAFRPEFKIDGETYQAIENKIFTWTPPIGSAPAKLIPLQPSGRIEVYWRVEGPIESDARIISVGSNRWPTEACSDLVDSDCFQVHIAGAPVQVEPAAGNYKVLELVLPSSGGSGATYSNGQFNAPFGGTSVLVYVNGPSLDQTQYPTLVEVVRSLGYTQAPMFVDNAPVEIGQPIHDAYHNEVGKTGYVINETSYYDGNGSDAAYQRNSRTGAIIAVNRYSDARPQEQGHELAVAWYHRKQKGVYWPEKAVRYAPHWPYDPERIIIASQKGGEVLGQTPLLPAQFPQARIYIQNDPGLPGYNPNDEHAIMAPSNADSGVDAVFALRSDFGSAIANDAAAASDPYVLIKYFNNTANQWRFRIYQVQATGSGFEQFRFAGTAGTTIAPPYPLSIMLPGCAETYVDGQAEGQPPPAPFFQDYTNQLWGKSAGSGAVFYYYHAQPGFFSDLDNDDVNDIVGSACQPWLARLPEADGGTPSLQEPIKVSYDLSWPDEVPLLVSGETLLAPKRGLPDIVNQAAVEVVYDDLQAAQANPEPSDTLAQLISPLRMRAVTLKLVPETVATDFNADGTFSILGSADGTQKLPVSIGQRIGYNPNTKELTFDGVFDESGAGEPFLLLDVMSLRDRVTLKKLDGGDGHGEDDYIGLCIDEDENCNWDQAIEALFRRSRNPQGIASICTASTYNALERTRICNAARAVTPDDVLIGYQDSNHDGILEPFQSVGSGAALTAGLSHGNGYMTVAFNNDPSLTPNPISLEIIYVGCLVNPPPPDVPTLVSTYQGQINVIAPENTFDEQLVLRHSGDFGGNPDALEFEWYYHPDMDGTPPMPVPDPENGQMNGWFKVPSDNPQGEVEISIAGANIQTLSDNWYLTRYRGLNACNNQTEWSVWAGQPGATPLDQRAQLAQGWVKRVLSRLNPFEARVRDFHAGPTNTFASMMIMLGERYSGPIALNSDPDNLNSIGLIEAYATVMRRAMQLSVDGTPPVNYPPANNAILLVASRLVDFYNLLGNEAFADAQDPTIGITTATGSFTLNPSIFNFQNQLDSLLSEELVLLRGRDDSGGPVAASPVYNRLFWNFTTGDGEVAYALSYNITDQNVDGFIDEFDARILFPQGHGDAWGHYLTATTIYYDLLRHPFYSWVPRPEAVTVAGVPIQVDFLDERQFADTAAQKAKTGAQIVDLTYRYNFVEDPEGQYQGYEDTDPQRAWGMSEWGRRAGMGAYFDWATVNAIVPAEDPNPAHTGIQRIQRSTVESIDEIAVNYDAVQAQVDEADAGLNPLGLAKNVVVFDFDPSQLDRFNTTMFEQVYQRAMKALENVNQIWLFANQLNNQIRRTQDNADNMFESGREQELDYANELIEVFGYPYSDDIGPGGTYPEGYDGPDMYHYMYIDVPALAGTGFDFDGEGGVRADLGINKIKSFTGAYTPAANGVNFFNFNPLNYDNSDCLASPQASGCPLGDLDTTDDQGNTNALEVEYTMIESPDFGLLFTKPDSWTGARRAPGELQQILQQMLEARIALKQATLDYDKLRLDIQATVETLQATFDVSEANINISISQRRQLQDLTIATEIMKNSAIVARRVGEFFNKTMDDTAGCVPSNTVFGLAGGGDLLSGVKCAIKFAGGGTKMILDTVADGLDIASNATDAAKEDVSELSGIRTQINDSALDLYNIKGEIDEMIRQEPAMRAEIFARAEAIKSLLGDYKAALARGLRVYQNLIIFRQEAAAGTQQYRYEDMAFRIFRNDALQKYRQSFDLAARYIYLAAAAYDYETNLLGSDSQAGQKFLTQIVKERSIGQVVDGQPVSGSPGLANVMAQMKLNFDVLKGQMGFNNPRVETNRFSLRKELFRIPDGAEHDAEWAAKLDSIRVDDLWSVPEFRRYARPFAPQSAGPQPGLVIEFSSNVTFGMNFFGWELGPGDSSYDSSQFATRIRSVGAWFANYASLPLADDPYIYVIPVGADILRSPSADDFTVRQWQIADQVIPTPFPIGTDDLNDLGWNARADSLNGGSMIDIRRYGAIPAYHYSEPFDDSQVTADSRLVGRSVWNRRWMIIIPGGTFLNDPDDGIETFIHGQEVPGGGGERDGHGVSDIRLFFKTYAYSGL